MSRQVEIAWALKINHVQLGARLEAYVETKSAVTTLRACLLRLRLPSNFSISPEISQMVVDNLRDASYEPKILSWHKAQRCVQDTCTLTDHFTQSEIVRFEIGRPNQPKNRFLFERMHRHHQVVANYIQKIKLPRSQREMRRFAVCKDIFAKDFGITPYFDVLEKYEYKNGHVLFKTPEISAYLTQSIVRPPLRSEPGPNEVSYSIQYGLDQTMLFGKMSANTKQQFLEAVKALRLEAAHTHSHVDNKSAYSQEPDDPLHEADEMNRSEEDSVPVHSEPSELSSNLKEAKTAEITMSCGCTHPIRDLWGRRIDYKTHCNDCGTDVCKGRYKACEPVLMLLGCGTLEAYRHE